MSKELMKEAATYLQNKEYEKAYEIFSLITEKEKEFVEARYHRALIDFSILNKNLENSLEDFLFVGKQNKDYSVTSLFYASLLADMLCRFDQSIEVAKEALSKYQKKDALSLGLYLDSLFVLAKNLYLRRLDNDLEDAAAYLEQYKNECLKQDDDASLSKEYYALACRISIALLEFDKVKKMIEQFQLHCGPSDLLYLVRAEYYLELLKEEDANKNELLSSIKNVACLYKQYTEDIVLIDRILAEAYALTGDFDNAFKIYEELKPLFPFDSWFIERTKIYDILEDYTKCIEELKTYLKENDSWRLKFTLGYILFEEAKNKEDLLVGKSYLEEAYQESKDFYVFYDLIHMNSRLFCYEENAILIEDFVKENELNGSLAYTLANAYEALNHPYEEVLSLLNMAYEQNEFSTLDYLDQIIPRSDNPKIYYKKLKKLLKNTKLEFDHYNFRKMGYRYLYGEDGFKQNPSLAFSYFSKSAIDSGNMHCQKNAMGRYYEVAEKNQKAAFKEYLEGYKALKEALYPMCNCVAGSLANAYLQGIGTQIDVEKAKQIILEQIDIYGLNSSNSVLYLYIFFALENEPEFSLMKAKDFLLQNHAYCRYEITRIVYKERLEKRIGPISTNDASFKLKNCLKYCGKAAKKYYKEQKKIEKTPYAFEQNL